MYLKYFPIAVASLHSCGAEAMMRLRPESLQAWAWGMGLQALQGILQTHPSDSAPTWNHLLFLGSVQTDQSRKSCLVFPLIPADFIAELDCACLPWAPTMLSLWGHSLELLLLLLTLRNFPMQRNPKKRALNPCCVHLAQELPGLCLSLQYSRQPSHNCCSTSSFSKGP